MELDDESIAIDFGIIELRLFDLGKNIDEGCG